jgi:hypothetical protein
VCGKADLLAANKPPNVSPISVSQFELLSSGGILFVWRGNAWIGWLWEAMGYDLFCVHGKDRMVYARSPRLIISIKKSYKLVMSGDSTLSLIGEVRNVLCDTLMTSQHFEIQ